MCAHIIAYYIKLGEETIVETIGECLEFVTCLYTSSHVLNKGYTVFKVKVLYFSGVVAGIKIYYCYDWHCRSLGFFVDWS